MRGGLARDCRGVAALEFAIIAPVMVIFFLGTVELANVLRVQAKVNTAAGQLAELVAGQQSVTAPNGSLVDVCKGAAFNILPYNTAVFSADIASETNDHPSNRVPGSTDSTTVYTYLDWENISSCAINAPTTMGSTVAFNYAMYPTSLLTATGLSTAPLAYGYSAIVVRANYSYSNVLSFLLGRTITFSGVALARPRSNTTIKCTNTAGTTACPLTQ